MYVQAQAHTHTHMHKMGGGKSAAETASECMHKTASAIRVASELTWAANARPRRLGWFGSLRFLLGAILAGWGAAAAMLWTRGQRHPHRILHKREDRRSCRRKSTSGEGARIAGPKCCHSEFRPKMRAPMWHIVQKAPLAVPGRLNLRLHTHRSCVKAWL